MADGHGDMQPSGGSAAATADPASARAASSTSGDLLRCAAVPAQYTGVVGTLAPGRTSAMAAAGTSSAAAALAPHVEEKASASLQRDPSSTTVPSENPRSAVQLGKSTLRDSSASSHEDSKNTYPAMSKCTGARSTAPAAMAAKVDSVERAASGLTNVAGIPISASSVERCTLRDIDNLRQPQPLVHEAAVCGASNIDVHLTIVGQTRSAAAVKVTRDGADKIEGNCDRLESCPVECATLYSIDNVSPRVEGEVGKVKLSRESRLAAGTDGHAAVYAFNKSTPNSAAVPPGEADGPHGGKRTMAVDGGAVGGATVRNAPSHEQRTPFMKATERCASGAVSEMIDVMHTSGSGLQPRTPAALTNAAAPAPDEDLPRIPDIATSGAVAAGSMPICVIISSAKETGIIAAGNGRCSDRSIEMATLSGKTERTAGESDWAGITVSGPSVNVLSEGSGTLIHGNTSDATTGTSASAGSASVRSTGAETLGGGIGAANASANAVGWGPDEVVVAGQASIVPVSSEGGTVAGSVPGNVALRTSYGSRSATGEPNPSSDSAPIDTGSSSAPSSTLSAPPSAAPSAATRMASSSSISEVENAATPREKSLSSADGDVPEAEPSSCNIVRAVSAEVLPVGSRSTPSCPSDRLQTADNAIVDDKVVEKTLRDRATYLHLQVIGPSPSNEKATSAKKVALTTPDGAPATATVVLERPGEYTLYVSAGPRWMPNVEHRSLSDRPIAVTSFTVRDCLFNTVDVEGCRSCQEPLRRRRFRHKSPLTSGSAPVRVRLIPKNDSVGDTSAGEQAQRAFCFLADVSVHVMVPTKSFHPCRRCPSGKDGTLLSSAFQRSMQAGALAQLHGSLSHDSTADAGEGSSAQAAASTAVSDAGSRSGMGTATLGDLGTVETVEEKIDVSDGPLPSVGPAVSGPNLAREWNSLPIAGASASTTNLSERNAPSGQNATSEAGAPSESGVLKERDIVSGGPEASVPSETVVARGPQVAEAKGDIQQIGADVGWGTDAKIPAVHKETIAPPWILGDKPCEDTLLSTRGVSGGLTRQGSPPAAGEMVHKRSANTPLPDTETSRLKPSVDGGSLGTRRGREVQKSASPSIHVLAGEKSESALDLGEAASTLRGGRVETRIKTPAMKSEGAAVTANAALLPLDIAKSSIETCVVPSTPSSASTEGAQTPTESTAPFPPGSCEKRSAAVLPSLAAAAGISGLPSLFCVVEDLPALANRSSVLSVTCPETREAEPGASSDDVACLTASNVGSAVAITAAEEPAISGALQAASASERPTDSEGDIAAQERVAGPSLAEPLGRASVKSSAATLENALRAPCAERKAAEVAGSDEARSKPLGEAPISTPANPPVPTPDAPCSTPATPMAARAVADTRLLSTASCDDCLAAGSDECAADCSWKCPAANTIGVGGEIHQRAEEAATSRAIVGRLPETADNPCILPLPRHGSRRPRGFCGRMVEFPIVVAPCGQAHQSPSPSGVASGPGVPTELNAKNDSSPPPQRLGVEKVPLPSDSSAPPVPVILDLSSPSSEGQLGSRRSSHARLSSSLTVASECPRCGARPWLDVPPLASRTECEVCLWRSDGEFATGRGANGQGTPFSAGETADTPDVGARVTRKQRSKFSVDTVGGTRSSAEGGERQSCEGDNRVSLPASLLAATATTSLASDGYAGNTEKLPDCTGALKSPMLHVSDREQHSHPRASPLERPPAGDAFTTSSGNCELWPAAVVSEVEPKLAMLAGTPKCQATVAPYTSAPTPIMAGTEKAAPTALSSSSAPSITHARGSAPHAGGRVVPIRTSPLGTPAVPRMSVGTPLAAPTDVVATEAGTPPSVLPTGRPSRSEQQRDDAARTRALPKAERKGSAAKGSISTSTESPRSEVGTAVTIATLADAHPTNAVLAATSGHREQGEPGVVATAANADPTNKTSTTASSTPLPRPNCHDATSTPIANPNRSWISNQRLPLATVSATAGEIPMSSRTPTLTTTGAFASSRGKTAESNVYCSATRNTLSDAEWGLAAGYQPSTFQPADRSLVDRREVGQLRQPSSSLLLPPAKAADTSSDEPPACRSVESRGPPWTVTATRRCAAENRAYNELKNQSAESPASAAAVATITAPASLMRTGPPASSRSGGPRVNSHGAPKDLPLANSRGGSNLNPRSRLRDGPQATPNDTLQSHPQVGVHDILAAAITATMASGGPTGTLDVGSSVGSFESTRNGFITSFFSRGRKDGNVRNPKDATGAGTHDAGERQSFGSADGHCVGRSGSSSVVGSGGSGDYAGGTSVQAVEKKRPHQSPFSVGHSSLPRNAESTGRAAAPTTGRKRPLSPSFLGFFAVTESPPEPSDPASRQWLDGAAHQSSKRKREGTVALASGEESLSTSAAGASPSADTLVSHAATITVGDSSSEEVTNDRIPVHDQAKKRPRGCQPGGVAFFFPTGRTHVPQPPTGSGMENGGSGPATSTGACFGYGGSNVSVCSEPAAPFISTCTRVGSMAGNTSKKSSAGAGGGPAGADETVGTRRCGAQAPHPKRTRGGVGVLDAKAGLGASAGEEGKAHMDRESLVTRGVMNAKILHMLFRCSEGAGGANDRLRRKKDELSRVYCSVGDPLIPDNTTWTAPVAGQPLPFDALFPDGDEELSVESSVGEHSPQRSWVALTSDGEDGHEEETDVESRDGEPEILLRSSPKRARVSHLSSSTRSGEGCFLR